MNNKQTNRGLEMSFLQIEYLPNDQINNCIFAITVVGGSFNAAQFMAAFKVIKCISW